MDSVWLRQPKNTEIRNFKLLYVGRIRVEKGIFALSELIRNKRDISLTIIGAEQGSSNKINQSNIKILPTQSNKTKLIKQYDDHNIFILPSFTEGHPMVLLESLARRRPVVIFDEIKHVIGDKKGIFISKRNFLSFLGTLNNIKKNYKKIQKEMRKNKLPTNKEFIEKFIKFKDKIKYLVVDELPNNLEEIFESDNKIIKEHKFINNAVKRENSQRNFINHALLNSDEDDFILISDLDEIPCLKNIDLKKINEKIVIFFTEQLWPRQPHHHSNP